MTRIDKAVLNVGKVSLAICTIALLISIVTAFSGCDYTTIKDGDYNKYDVDASAGTGGEGGMVTAGDTSETISHSTGDPAYCVDCHLIIDGDDKSAHASVVSDGQCGTCHTFNEQEK